MNIGRSRPIMERTRYSRRRPFLVTTKKHGCIGTRKGHKDEALFSCSRTPSPKKMITELVKIGRNETG